MTAAHFWVSLQALLNQILVQQRTVLSLALAGGFAQTKVPARQGQHVAVMVLFSVTIEPAAGEMLPLYVAWLGDDAGTDRVAVNVEHQLHELFVIFYLECLGPSVGHLAEAFVTFIEVQAKDAVGSAHVSGEGGKAVLDLAGLMAMLCAVICYVQLLEFYASLQSVEFFCCT